MSIKNFKMNLQFFFFHCSCKCSPGKISILWWIWSLFFCQWEGKCTYITTTDMKWNERWKKKNQMLTAKRKKRRANKKWWALQNCTNITLVKSLHPILKLRSPRPLIPWLSLAFTYLHTYMYVCTYQRNLQTSPDRGTWSLFSFAKKLQYSFLRRPFLFVLFGVVLLLQLGTCIFSFAFALIIKLGTRNTHVWIEIMNNAILLRYSSKISFLRHSPLSFSFLFLVCNEFSFSKRTKVVISTFSFFQHHFCVSSSFGFDRKLWLNITLLLKKTNY